MPINAPSDPRSRDRDLRLLLHARLSADHGADDHAVITDEFSICRAQARVDVALVNGCLAGFEIKSDVDRLDRLASQVPQYARVFDEMTLVCAPRHAEQALLRLPAWWAVWNADPRACDPLVEVRPGSRNSDVCSRSTAGLLWREEMLDLLASYGFEKGTLSKPRRALLDRLVESFDARVLAGHVRSQLRTRLRRAQLDLTVH